MDRRHIAGVNCPMEWGIIGIILNIEFRFAQLHVLPTRWCEYVSEVMRARYLQASSWHTCRCSIKS